MSTLGQLRSYVADNAADMADGKADRVILRHVNAAVMRVFHAHPWSFYRAVAQIPLDVGETGTALSCTADSNVVTLASTEVFKSKYLDEGWILDVDEDDDLLFTLAEIRDNQTAVLADGQKWIGTTASSLAYTWRRSVYPLPDLTREVSQVQLSASRVDVIYLRPDLFDRVKLDQPTDVGEPRHYTIRGRFMEVWPTLAPTATRQTMQVHYLRNPRRFTDSDADETAVDFDARYDDLIERALDMEIVTHHRPSTTIDPGLAMQAFADRLAVYKAADEGLATRPRNMSLGRTPSLKRVEEWWARRGQAGSEV